MRRSRGEKAPEKVHEKEPGKVREKETGKVLEQEPEKVHRQEPTKVCGQRNMQTSSLYDIKEWNQHEAAVHKWQRTNNST
jgi:hypothetical protein